MDPKLKVNQYILYIVPNDKPIHTDSHKALMFVRWVI